MTTTAPEAPRGKPEWLKRRLPSGEAFGQVEALIRRGRLHTVCQAAKCPNIWECFSNRTATFLIMGGRCTRNCAFCAVDSGRPEPLDPEEPGRVAAAAAAMGLAYVVVTSVTRDDLPDGGAAHFAAVIRAVREKIPGVRIEVLIPDFRGDAAAIAAVVAARPDVVNHNIETVPRLYPRVRPQADYRRSLELIAAVGRLDPAVPAKSGLMLGLGEAEEEVRATLADLRAAGCRVLTLGQYLQPSAAHLPVERFVPPEEFAAWRSAALALGFDAVASGPFVRSSYHAQASYQAVEKQAPGCRPRHRPPAAGGGARRPGP
jgi:lipoic acid synthetase